MSSHRTLRVAEAIREVVATAILFELNDPRVKNITVLRAEVTADLRNATVYVSVMGSEVERKLSLRGLEHAGGYLQRKVAARLQTKVTPVLRFKVDDTLRHTVDLAKLIEEAVASDRKPGAEPEPGPEAGPDEAPAAGSGSPSPEPGPDSPDSDPS
jgi:ribosome-binding factor A